jgi:hypothetical protein
VKVLVLDKGTYFWVSIQNPKLKIQNSRFKIQNSKVNSQGALGKVPRKQARGRREKTSNRRVPWQIKVRGPKFRGKRENSLS